MEAQTDGKTTTVKLIVDGQHFTRSRYRTSSPNPLSTHKRKDVDLSVAVDSPSNFTLTKDNSLQGDVEEIDLRGCAATPGALKSYLKKRFSRRPSPSSQWSVLTDQFPRGCMQVLLDHIAPHQIQITQFQNLYGKVYKYHLQNPDLKLLLKNHGQWLTHLRMVPLLAESPAPKLQGCGYRWIARYTHQLKVLELSLQYDVKNELLDLTRRTPLQVTELRELILRDAHRITRPQLADLVANAPDLERLEVRDADEGKMAEDNVQDAAMEEDNLGSFFETAAQKVGRQVDDFVMDD